MALNDEQQDMAHKLIMQLTEENRILSERCSSLESKVDALEDEITEMNEWN